MSEQVDDLAATRPAEPAAAEQDKPRRWPLISGIVIVFAIAATALVQFLGAPVALVVAGCGAGAVVLGFIVWRLPQLRKHFGLGRGRSGKRWSFGMKRLSGKRSGGGGFKLPKLGGRGGGLGKGKGLPKLGARSGGKGLAGRGKALGRALTGKGRALGKGLTGKAKSLGRVLTGKGRSGAKGKALPKLGGKIAGAKAGLRRLLSGRAAAGKGLKLPKLGGKRGAAGGKTSGKAGLLRRAGRRLRHPFSGKRGGKNGTATGKGQGGGKARKSGLITGMRAVARGTRSAFRRGRKAAGSKPGQSRWRKIGTAAAAVPFIPFIGAWAAWKRARAWWRKRGDPKPCAILACPNKAMPGESSPGHPEVFCADCHAAIYRPDDPAEPEAPPERHPGPAMGPDSNGTTRRQPMSSAIEAVSEAIDTHIGGFEPENVDDLRTFLGDMPGRYEREASALDRLAERLSGEFPVHEDVAELFRELAARAAGSGEYAGELVRLFEGRHEEDLNRLDNPRPNEPFMDAGNQ